MGFLDQTQQRQPAADRTSQEQRFATLLERVNDMVSVVSTDGKVLFRSSSSQRMTGFPAQAVVGSDVRDFIYAEDHPRIAQVLEQCAASPSGTALPVELRMLMSDGDPAWFETIVVNALDDPLIGGMVCTCRNITDRKRVEERVRVSERRLLTAFDTAQDLLVVFDAGGQVRQVSMRVLANVLGFGVGTQVIGVASDALHAWSPDQSLRYAMLGFTVTALWALGHFVLAARAMRAYSSPATA